MSLGSAAILTSGTDYVFNVVATDTANATDSIEVSVEAAACDAVWCAELTAQSDAGDEFVGYETGQHGKLLPSRAISVGSVTYYISDITDDDSSELAPTLYLGFDERTAHTDLADDGLSLTIGGTSYALDAQSADALGYFNWDITGAVFSDGDKYQLTIVAANRAPVFPASETGNRSVAENTASGEPIGDAIAATDADGHTLTYSLGGTDEASFAIETTNGQLKTNAALNYEAPADADTDNSYEVTVSVSDGTATATITVTISVTNVDEPGTVSIAPASPVVGT